MGIIEIEDLRAWNDNGKIYCVNCGDPGEAEALTEEDFNDDDIVICDECKGRIQ